LTSPAGRLSALLLCRFSFIWYIYHLEGKVIVRAFSRLKRLLEAQAMTVPELHRRVLRQGLRVNLKSLYRLSDDRRPLQRLDLRVAGAICQVFALPLSELIAFESPKRKLRRLAAGKQKRLDALMARGNDGRLTGAEKEELRALVREAEEVMLDNARRLAEQRQQIATP
jgi:hypothetical protein